MCLACRGVVSPHSPRWRP